MKRNKKPSGDYAQLQTKALVRAFVMILGAIGIVWLLYRLVLYGNFSEWMVALFQRLFRMDYTDALHLHRRIFRDNMDIFFLVGAILLFALIFRFYLGWLTRYFSEINRGIDALIAEDAGDVALSPELSAIERKINAIKHTLEKRKLDTQFAEQQKNDLIVYLAHDLKTPLTSVIGYMTLLRDEPDLPADLRAKYAGIALDKAQRLESLINEFFDITRFSLTQMTLELETINLTRMLQQVAHEFGPVLSEKSLTFDLQMAPDVQIACDPDKLERVFDNLLRNAVNYSYSGRSIVVALAEEDGHAIVRITNEGKAIPAEKLQRIFDQFFRLDSARSSATGGAGLGLAIAKGIVELHGGTIVAESEGERITFAVSLPTARPTIG